MVVETGWFFFFFFSFENVIFLNIRQFWYIPKKGEWRNKNKNGCEYGRNMEKRKKKGKNRLICENFLFEFPPFNEHCLG